MNNHFRVLSRLANTPLYISEDKLSILSANVILPLLANSKPMADNGFSPTVKEVPTTATKLGLVKVFDSLVSKNGAGASGFTSYEDIKNQSLHLINSGVTKIGYYVSGPGGEAGGLFGLTDFINSIPEKYGVETFAFTDDYATSASYAILASVQKVYAAPGAVVGSIAAVTSLVDLTESDKQKGIKYTILRSKDEKALYNPHEELSDKVIEKAKTSLEVLDKQFNMTINKYRPNVSIESIINMKGNHFHVEQALELGLIDSVVSSLDEVLSLETTTKTSGKSSSTNRGSKMATLEELNTRIDALVKENETLQTSVAGLVTEAVTKERTRCSEIFKAGMELKVSSDLIFKRLNSGSSKEDSLEIFTAVAEASDAGKAINTAPGLQETITSLAEEHQFNVGDFKVSANDIINAAKSLGGK